MAKKKKKKVKVSRSKKGVLVNQVIRQSGQIRDMPVTVYNAQKGRKSICSFCGLNFFVSRDTALFLRDLKQEVSGRWTSHEIIGKKSKSEFLGPDMRSLSFEIIIDARFGYKPYTTLKKLQEIVEKGKVDAFYVGTNKIGTKWKMSKISEEYDVIYHGGKIAKASVNATLEEY